MNSKRSYSPETPNLGQIRWFLEPCDLEIWRMTLKNNRAPLLCYFKLCASFRSHWWIQTGVTVRKRPIWVKFDDFLSLWPWPLTLTFCMDITFVIGNNSWKFHGDTMMGTLSKRCHRQTDGNSHSWSCLVAAKNKKINTKEGGHPLSWLVIGDGNSTSVYSIFH